MKKRPIGYGGCDDRGTFHVPIPGKPKSRGEPADITPGLAPHLFKVRIFARLKPGPSLPALSEVAETNIPILCRERARRFPVGNDVMILGRVR